MTVSSTAGKAFVFTAVLVAAAVTGFTTVTPDPGGAAVWPLWSWWVGLAALVVAMLTLARPLFAALTGLIYAVLEGLMLGAVSAVYEVRFDGIVVQAVILTIAVLVATLLLYMVGAVNASGRLARGVTVAMGGLVLLYLFGWISSLFGVDAAFWARPTSFGIFVSVAVVALAALNLELDFDMIENLSGSGAPRNMEWYAAFGLTPHTRVALSGSHPPDRTESRTPIARRRAPWPPRSRVGIRNRARSVNRRTRTDTEGGNDCGESEHHEKHAGEQRESPHVPSPNPSRLCPRTRSARTRNNVPLA